MGGPTALLWTTPRPWRPPNVILRSSREHFWEMFLIRTRDDGGSEDRSCTIDNGCFELVERCRYVTGGMEFDLTPLPSTTDVSFVYNTPTPFVTLHSSSSSNFQMNFARSRPDSDGTPVSCSKPERAIEEAPVDLESSASKEDK